jgi:hypothetical protein
MTCLSRKKQILLKGGIQAMLVDNHIFEDYYEQLRLEERQKQLVKEIADFLTDWSDDIESTMSFDESIETIEGYGISMVNPCAQLVVNAIRHLVYMVNLWHDKDIPYLLMDLGFSFEECVYYWSASGKMAIPVDCDRFCCSKSECCDSYTPRL